MTLAFENYLGVLSHGLSTPNNCVCVRKAVSFFLANKKYYLHWVQWKLTQTCRLTGFTSRENYRFPMCSTRRPLKIFKWSNRKRDTTACCLLVTILRAQNLIRNYLQFGKAIKYELKWHVRSTRLGSKEKKLRRSPCVCARPIFRNTTEKSRSSMNDFDSRLSLWI